MQPTHVRYYYREELKKLGPAETIKIVSEHARTNYMNLNKDSIKEIIRFFKSCLEK